MQSRFVTCVLSFLVNISEVMLVVRKEPLFEFKSSESCLKKKKVVKFMQEKEICKSCDQEIFCHRQPL